MNMADVYLSLNGIVIPNNGYVDISDIGSNDDTALLCHTNQPPHPGSAHSGGDWYGPDSTRVAYATVPGFTRNRDPMVVRLIRGTDWFTGTPPEGIYQCSYYGAEFEVYVGLYYNTGGGIIVVHKPLQVTLPLQVILHSHCLKILT